MTLTRAGELLLGHAESIMTRLSAARIDLDSLGDEDVGGPIRVGAYQSVAAAILPLILQELGAEPGEVEFALTESNDDRELLELLERGELDVAFTELPLPEGSLELRRSSRTRTCCSSTRITPYADLDRELTLEEVAAVPLITLQARLRPGQARRRVRDPRAHAPLCPSRRGQRHAPRLRRRRARLRPRAAARRRRRGKPLVALPIESRLPHRTVAIAWHRDRLRTCTAGMFVDLAVEVSAQLDCAAQPALD